MKIGKIIALVALVAGVIIAAVFTTLFVDDLSIPEINIELICYAHFGAVTALHGLFCLIFYKTVTRSCHIWTSLASLALSACAGIGGGCFVTMMSAIAFSEQHLKHPLDQTYGALGTLVAGIAFLAFFCLYCILRSKRSSRLGVLFDVIFSLNYIPTFYLVFCYLYLIAKALIKG